MRFGRPFAVRQDFTPYLILVDRPEKRHASYSCICTVSGALRTVEPWCVEKEEAIDVDAERRRWTR